MSPGCNRQPDLFVPALLWLVIAACLWLLSAPKLAIAGVWLAGVYAGMFLENNACGEERG